jgi:hypothetical protein
VRLRNTLAQHTFEVARECVANSVPVTIENPKASIMWGTAACTSFEAAAATHHILLDYCQYGTLYRKSTRLLIAAADNTFLAALSRRCCGTHEHINLSGWKPRNKPGKVMHPTHKAAAYPKQLTAVWAASVRKYLADSKAFRREEDCFTLG